MKGLSPRAQRLIVALSQDEARKIGSSYILHCFLKFILEL